MSVRRLVLTGAVMGCVAALLAAVTPSLTEMAGALAAAQRTVDTAGADALVVATAGLLAWTVWAWGCLGLALTAASALPGLVGGVARLGAQVVLPAGARRSAAALLGLGLGVVAPLAGIATTALAVPAAAAAPAGSVPDWPVGSASPAAGSAPGPAAARDGAAVPDRAAVPDWPDTSVPADGSHVVVRGDCLWHIAETRLLERSGTPPTDDEIARTVQAWWTANAAVIGPDPDRLLPGQVLRPPGAP
jgi:nucleoid-associated protein YgaU